MSTPTVEHFYHEGSNTITFVVYDPATKDAVVIDPVLDLDTFAWQLSTESCDKVLAFATANGLKVHLIMDTHTHADHVTGGSYLSDVLKVPYAIGAKITSVQQSFSALYGLSDFKCDGSQFGRLLAEDEVLTLGALSIRCIATHGHTPNCLSYFIGDAVFVGDAIFTEDFGTGRCDFPGGSAEDLFDSIQKIFALPVETRVFVGHDYQPGGRALRVSSTVDLEREKNEDITCRATKEEFVAMKKKWDATLSFPRLIFPSIFLNMNAGRLPAAESNGRRYLKIPLNMKFATDDLGRKA